MLHGSSCNICSTMHNANMNNNGKATITIAGCFIIMRHPSGKITRERTYLAGKHLQQYIQGFVNLGFEWIK